MLLPIPFTNISAMVSNNMGSWVSQMTGHWSSLIGTEIAWGMANSYIVSISWLRGHILAESRHDVPIRTDIWLHEGFAIAAVYLASLSSGLSKGWLRQFGSSEIKYGQHRQIPAIEINLALLRCWYGVFLVPRKYRCNTNIYKKQLTITSNTLENLTTPRKYW